MEGEGEMDKFEIGDLVVLTAGSMRMAVEAVDEDRVHCVWVHEGKVSRDSFLPVLLKRWEVRETHESRGEPQRRGRDDDEGRRGPGGGKPFAKPYAKPYGGPASPGAGKPRPRPTGWDGKPREKKFFRKD
jgi:uncharacterized protein YodC (DUF2158 family)